LDGSDLKTQIKVKEIAGIVKQLVEKFQSRFTISKVAVNLQRYSCRSVSHKLRLYWDAPTPEKQKSINRDNPKIQSLIRIQIDDWTYEAPKLITVGMTRECLL
jgi:hypothetical protein